MENFVKTITAGLKELLISNSEVISAWEGGSAATGYKDELSDLDLVLICKDQSVDEIFKQIEKFLDRNYRIKTTFHVPQPAWHGHSQKFYILHQSPDLFYVDLLIQKESAGNRFLEPDRHGNAQVWFDKQGLINPVLSDAEEAKKKMAKMFWIIEQSYELLIRDVKKQLVRKNLIDAMDEYQVLVSRRLVPLLNFKYRPAKYDFGMRYTYRDFPQKICEKVENLLLINNLNHLQEKLDCAQKWIENLIDEHKPKFSCN
ncbi:MAG: hypothetical protein ACP5FK_06785 [bacterium]